MSTVFLQVGQCGNQIGKEFYKTVGKLGTTTTSATKSKPVFTSQDGKWRSINVDSEAKVVKNFYRENPQNLRECNMITGKHGRGANWAMGYRETKEMLSHLLEVFRQEVERCDCYSGAVMIHSLSGGTGSGLGCHLCELLRDEYPLAYILSAVVAPHASGESPLQNYNCLLSLAWLQRFADGIFLFQNDEVLRRLTGGTRPAMRRTPIMADVSLSDMNLYIGDCLSGMFLPTGDTNCPGICVGYEPWELLRSVCPMPAYKCVHTTSIKSKTFSWESITTGLVSTLNRYSNNGQLFSSLANLAVIRAQSMRQSPSSVKAIETKLKTAYNCVKWNPFPIDFWIGTKNLTGSNENSLTVCSNSNSCVDFAQNVFVKADIMYKSKAYLHWYQQWGCDESYFLEAFDTLQNLIQNYASASTDSPN